MNPTIDLILMDIMMPEMDGYQATREIRKMPEFGSLPIVALTAKAMQEDRQKCVEFGCSDFIPKPVENEKLLSIIQRWTEHREE
jgi:two-component system chemotaxis sensor kinase CheA